MAKSGRKSGEEIAATLRGKAGLSGEVGPVSSAMDFQAPNSSPRTFYKAPESFARVRQAPSPELSGIRAARAAFAQPASPGYAAPPQAAGRYVDRRPRFDSPGGGVRGGIAPGSAPTRGFFEGGMAMQPPSMQPPPMQAPPMPMQPPPMPMQPPPMPPMQAPQMPQDPMQGDMDPGMAGGGDEMILLYNAAREVLINDPNGENPQSEQIIQMFIEIFGEEAFQALLMDTASPGGMGGPEMDPMAAGQIPGIEPAGMAFGGMIDGAGDGTSDSVRGNIDGVEEVRLSSGEYIVPADAVSGLGNGSSEAGAKRLMSLVDSVRSSRTGNTGLPPRV